MANEIARGKSRGRRRVKPLFLVLLLLASFSQAADESSLIRFSDLSLVREVAAMFPPTPPGEPASEGLVRGGLLLDRDRLERAKKRVRIATENWPLDAGAPEGATLTVLSNWVEHGGLGFRFVTESSGTVFLEIHAPRAPDTGPFSVRIGNWKSSPLDLWAPASEPSAWRRLSGPVELVSGEHRIDLIQLSPTDSPLRLRGFRFTPSASPTSPSDVGSGLRTLPNPKAIVNSQE